MFRRFCSERSCWTGSTEKEGCPKAARGELILNARIRSQQLLGLESEPCEGLQFTGRARACNLAEAGAVGEVGRGADRSHRERCVWRREVRVIDDVEGIHAELELECFEEGEGP